MGTKSRPRERDQRRYLRHNSEHTFSSSWRAVTEYESRVRFLEMLLSRRLQNIPEVESGRPPAACVLVPLRLSDADGSSSCCCSLSASSKYRGLFLARLLSRASRLGGFPPTTGAMPSTRMSSLQNARECFLAGESCSSASSGRRRFAISGGSIKSAGQKTTLHFISTARCDISPITCSKAQAWRAQDSSAGRTSASLSSPQHLIGCWNFPPGVRMLSLRYCVDSCKNIFAVLKFDC